MIMLLLKLLLMQSKSFNCFQNYTLKAKRFSINHIRKICGKLLLMTKLEKKKVFKEEIKI